MCPSLARDKALCERRRMCPYCQEAIDTSQTYIMQAGKSVHLVCWMTVYRCQLEQALQEIRARERR
jgi:hypothetical protein